MALDWLRHCPFVFQRRHQPVAASMKTPPGTPPRNRLVAAVATKLRRKAGTAAAVTVVAVATGLLETGQWIHPRVDDNLWSLDNAAVEMR